MKFSPLLFPRSLCWDNETAPFTLKLPPLLHLLLSHVCLSPKHNILTQSLTSLCPRSLCLENDEAVVSDAVVCVGGGAFPAAYSSGLDLLTRWDWFHSRVIYCDCLCCDVDSHAQSKHDELHLIRKACCGRSTNHKSKFKNHNHFNTASQV